jgi:quercetin dioxygenase-like cupin family protein
VSGADRFAERGLQPSAWEAGPGAVFPSHRHPRAKLLVCRSGSIRFTLEPSGEVRDLRLGEWLELPAGQDHSALAGPAGVRCEEAFHDGRAGG